MTTNDTPRKMWAGAPSLIQIEACQQGGKRGAQLWGVQQNYKLTSTFQVSPGGNWSEWLGPNWNGMNQPVFDIAGALQNNGNVQLWVIDNRQQLYSISQTSPGGGWGQWSGPNWNNAPRMNNIGAAQQRGNRGAQLWGVTEDYTLTTTYQVSPGGNWSEWKVWMGAPNTKDVTAADQNDGRVQLFLIDDQLQLWSAWQTSPGGGWTTTHGPNWNNAPKMWNICAAQQGGNRGAQLWGIDENYQLVTCYQTTPGGNWSGWNAWPNTPPVVEIAAAGQNNGCVQLWVLTNDGALISTRQTAPGGNWTGWETEVVIDFQGNPMTDNRRRDRP